MTTLPPNINIGTNAGATNPFYNDPGSKDNIQELRNTRIQQGHSQNRGVPLAQDSLDIPIELQFGINNERTESSRPTLMPLNRTRFVQMPPISSSYEQEYIQLRNSLPEDLRTKLEEDERLHFSKRDPDLIAFNESLKFEAARRMMIQYLAAPPADLERALASAANYSNMPETILKNILSHSSHVLNKIDDYLNQIGPNDPSYDNYLNASNLAHDAIRILKE